MVKINKHDFVEIEYTGRVLEDGTIFDTTDIEIAKKSGIYSESSSYGPLVICVGEGQVIKGIEVYLETADVPSETTLAIQPEEGFGRKESKWIQMIPTKKFIQQQIMPVVGLQVNIDGMMGIIKSVGGGRAIVDFNHPLSSKDLSYSIKVNRIVTEENKKIEGLLRPQLGPSVVVEQREGIFYINSSHDVPKEIQEILIQKIKEVIPSIKEITFVKENK